MDACLTRSVHGLGVFFPPELYEASKQTHKTNKMQIIFTSHLSEKCSPLHLAFYHVKADDYRDKAPVKASV